MRKHSKHIQTLSIKGLSLFMCLCIVTLLVNNFNVKAHEFSPKRYWNDIYYHSGMQKHVVRLKYNIDNVKDAVYKRKLQNAINDWEYLDNGYCDLQSASTFSAGLKIYDSFPSSYNQSVYALTSSYTENSLIRVYGGSNSNTGPAQVQSCNKITSAKIYANIKKQSSDSFNEADIAHTWVHEIGHAIGLNETNDGTRSAMRQGRGRDFGWSNYWQPQAHDTQDVARYRYVSWQ
ncbi:MAG: hypothetical protein ACLSAP_07855 [Oscillospiraceae bacterium]